MVVVHLFIMLKNESHVLHKCDQIIPLTIINIRLYVKNNMRYNITFPFINH